MEHNNPFVIIWCPEKVPLNEKGIIPAGIMAEANRET